MRHMAKQQAWPYEDEGGETAADEHYRNLMREAFTYVMADRNGRRFVRWVLSVAGESRSCSCENALRMARISGMRDVGLDVRAAVEAAAPGFWDQLLKEDRDERRELAELRGSGSGADDGPAGFGY